jgi:FkbM family methyltransferase
MNPVNSMQFNIFVPSPFRRLIARDDFRRNPGKALAKRVLWRMRWAANSAPIELRHAAGFSISAPKGAAGALIYYLGRSEPETFEFVTRVLKPGMVFFDVGAHIGEYTLIAASRVGGSGEVHAFEAQPATAALLRSNCHANHVRNATINVCAVADQEGTVEFEICSEPSMSSIVGYQAAGRRTGTICVPAVTLDAYCERQDVRPDVLKIDVEGAEWMVLQGATHTLARSSPIVLFECLESTYARFGASPGKVIAFLERLEYRIYEISKGGELVAYQAPSPNTKGYNLVALKS